MLWRQQTNFHFRNTKSFELEVNGLTTNFHLPTDNPSLFDIHSTSQALKNMTRSFLAGFKVCFVRGNTEGGTRVNDCLEFIIILRQQAKGTKERGPTAGATLKGEQSIGGDTPSQVNWRRSSRRTRGTRDELTTVKSVQSIKWMM